MTRALLDANVLIALTLAEHEHHRRASAWFTAAEGFAVCPVVEGALIRFLIRMGESTTTATAVLAGVRAHPRCEFWPGSVSYLDADLSAVRGHRQVTDAYLVSLARHHGGSLVTFDRALAAAHPGVVELIG